MMRMAFMAYILEQSIAGQEGPDLKLFCNIKWCSMYLAWCMWTTTTCVRQSTRFSTFAKNTNATATMLAAATVYAWRVQGIYYCTYIVSSRPWTFCMLMVRNMFSSVVAICHLVMHCCHDLQPPEVQPSPSHGFALRRTCTLYKQMTYKQLLTLPLIGCRPLHLCGQLLPNSMMALRLLAMVRRGLRERQHCCAVTEDGPWFWCPHAPILTAGQLAVWWFLHTYTVYSKCMLMEMIDKWIGVWAMSLRLSNWSDEQLTRVYIWATDDNLWWIMLSLTDWAVATIVVIMSNWPVVAAAANISSAAVFRPWCCGMRNIGQKHQK